MSTLEILSLGAGVQSSAVLLMSCVGELPKLAAAVFADTQWEPAAVYQHLDWLDTMARASGIPIYRVTAGDLRAWAIAPRKSASGKSYDTLPFHTVGPHGDGIAHRACTERFKIKPIREHVKRLAGTAAVRQWLGISWDEASRMKPSGVKWITNVYPLIERRMRRTDCLRWMAEHGFPRPPRSACIGCPFRNDSEWRELRRAERGAEHWRDAISFERAVRDEQPRVFLHRQRVPLDRVDLSTAEERGQLSLFGNECEGMCGV